MIDVRSHRFTSDPKPDPTKLCHEMLGRGIVVTPGNTFGCLSTPMTERELDAYINAMDESLTALAFGA